MLYVFTLCLAFLLSLAATLLVRRVARAYGLVAYPRADRWHTQPTALFGGVAIGAAMLASFLGVAAPAGLLATGGVRTLLACSLAMFLLGAIDDRLRLRPGGKLLFQLLIALVFTRYGWRLHWLPHSALDHALTVLWLVGITNALNLLDNIDGLAGGVTAIGASVLVLLCHGAGQPAYAALAAALVGATCGFLVFNFNPASIFMGDCGSLLLGFQLAGLALVTAQPGGRRNLLAVLLGPVLLLLLPILDTALVTISRKLAGRPISTGGRDHTSHRLVALGLSERAATLTLWALSALAGGAAVLIQTTEVFVGLALAALLLVALVYLAVFLGKVQVYGAHPERSPALLRWLSRWRRLFEVISDVACIILAYYLAFLLRYEGQLPGPVAEQLLRSLPVLGLVQLGAFFTFGLYRSVWGASSAGDLLQQLRPVLAAAALSSAAVLIQFRFTGFSRAVLAIDGVLLLLGVSGSRLSFRLMAAVVRRLRRPPPPRARRALIYGAGRHGELLLQECEDGSLASLDYSGLVPVGFIDDDPQKRGRVVGGLQVLGGAADLPGILPETAAAELLVAVQPLPPERLAQLRATCDQAGVRLRTMRIALE